MKSEESNMHIVKISFDSISLFEETELLQTGLETVDSWLICSAKAEVDGKGCDNLGHLKLIPHENGHSLLTRTRKQKGFFAVTESELSIGKTTFIKLCSEVESDNLKMVKLYFKTHTDDLAGSDIEYESSLEFERVVILNERNNIKENDTSSVEDRITELSSDYESLNNNLDKIEAALNDVTSQAASQYDVDTCVGILSQRIDTLERPKLQPITFMILGVMIGAAVAFILESY
jgi:hypothetical protein